MSTSAERSQLKRVANYVGANLALGRAIHQNEKDSRAHKQGEQLCYFVDTNIVRWYLNPLEEFSLVKALLPPDDLKRLKTVEFASNVIAAHYVFSYLLVGSNGFAPFLTPFHAEELHDSLEKEVALFREQVRYDLVTPKLRSAADNLVKAFDQFKSDSTMSALSELFDAFSNVLTHAFGSIAFRRARTRRLFLDNRVARADEYEDFNLDQSYLANSKLLEWQDLLLESGKTTEDSINLERDARSLCLLERLVYDATTRNKPIRYLMISADASLHEAVDRWRSKNGLLAIPQFDFLRHPREYIPIINLNAMHPLVSETIHGFSELMQSVDDISFSISSDDSAQSVHGVDLSSHFPDRFSRIIHDRVSDEKLLGLAPKVDQLSKRWTNALETSVLMNAEFVVGIADDYVARSIKPLADRELDETLQKQILEDIQQIANGHIDFAGRGQLAVLLKTIRRAKERAPAAQGITRHARSPSLVRLRVPRTLARMARGIGEKAPRDLAGFVAEYVFSQDEQLLDEFEQAVKEVSAVEVAATACIVAFRLNRWEQARYLADRLIQAHPQHDPNQAEFEYLRLVTDRFSGLSLEDLQRNRRLLEARIKTCRQTNDEYGFIRSLAEVGAQCLFYGYSQALITSEARPIASEYVWATIYDAIGYLDRARRALERASSERQLTQTDPRMLQLLRIHIFANTLSAYFFTELRPIPAPESSRARQPSSPESVVDELYQLTFSDDKAFRLAEFYALCARKHLGAARWAEKEQTRLRTVLSAFSRDQKHFEEIDRREVKWLCGKLGLSATAS
jgi:hypothetical protein